MDSETTVTQLIEFLKPILRSEGGKSTAEPASLIEEQSFVGRIVHLVVQDDPHLYFKMLEIFKTELLSGGEERFVHTVPSLVYAYLNLARYIKLCREKSESTEASEEEEANEEDNGEKKIFNRHTKYYREEIQLQYQDLFQIIKVLVEKLSLHHPALALRLNLSLISGINEVVADKEVFPIVTLL